MKKINFLKMVATGNDFILVDNRQNAFDDLAEHWPEVAQKLCPRKNAVGADGILVLEQSEQAQTCMRIFNPDGSEAAMCGNGARCVSYFLATEKGLQKVNFQTKAGLLEAEVNARRVKLKMTAPHDLRLDFELTVGEQTYITNFINTGVPHTVIFVEDIDVIDVNALGKEVRLHPEFQPEGTNVNFVQVVNENTIKVRTYERGVEEETLACGTGNVAAAIITATKMRKEKKKHFNIECLTKGGEILLVSFDLSEKKAENVYLEGEVKISFSGEVEL
jgi:diaminopimelate epimerase